MEKAQILVHGTDPEVFSAYQKDGKLFVLPPGVARMKGVRHIPDKKHPVFYNDKDAGIQIIEDGVAWEFTIRPSTNWEELFDRVQLAKKILEEQILVQLLDECDGKVYSVPTINYEVSRWKKAGTELEQCFIFGCDADYDAFDGGAKGKVVDALSHKFRYAGGHRHISGVPGFADDPLFGVQCLAIGVGLAAVAYSEVPELDRERTYLYGRPGKFRIQEYSSLFNDIPHTNIGLEYRTPSVAWTSSKEHAKQLNKWTEISVRNLFEEGLGAEILAKFSKEIQETIVACNQRTALEILSLVESKL